MNKRTITIWAVRIILIALIIWWMTVIFGFSAEDGQQSQSFSDRITIKVVKVIYPDYDSLTLASQKMHFNKISFLVRKTGHFGEYAILGILWSVFLLSFGRARRLKYRIFTVIPVFICMIYASTDEFHQGFVDGRSPKVMDVIIDTCGALAGVLFILIVRYIFERKIWVHFRRKHEYLGTEH